MDNLKSVEEHYDICSAKPIYQSISKHMLIVLSHLKEHLDLEKFEVGTSMLLLVIWKIGGSSRRFQIDWTEEAGYMISTDRFELHSEQVSLEQIPEKIKTLL